MGEATRKDCFSLDGARQQHGSYFGPRLGETVLQELPGLLRKGQNDGMSASAATGRTSRGIQGNVSFIAIYLKNENVPSAFRSHLALFPAATLAGRDLWASQSAGEADSYNKPCPGSWEKVMTGANLQCRRVFLLLSPVLYLSISHNG